MRSRYLRWTVSGPYRRERIGLLARALRYLAWLLGGQGR